MPGQEILHAQSFPQNASAHVYTLNALEKLWNSFDIKGYKIDAIKRCDKACFCVYDKGFKRDGEWALNIKSVVIFGRIHLLEDVQLSKEICTKLSLKFTDDTDYIQKELETAFSRVQCLEFTIEHMTGKLVNES